jgi:glycosyltransferase involved in cell wall biosynthesis
MVSSLTLPKVIIDARMVGPIPHGISRYVCYLAQALAALNQKQALLYQPIFLINSKYPESHFYSFETVRVESPFLHYGELFEIPKKLRAIKADLYHSPSFSSLWRAPCPALITVHDLNHLHFGSLMQKVYYHTLLRKFSKSSKTIITVSEFSRRELSRWLNVPPERIELVPNTVTEPATRQDDLLLYEGLLKEHRLEKNKYFYCLSNSKPHKNLPLLLNAYALFCKQQKEPWPLVITAQMPGGPFPKSVVMVGALSEGEANLLLKNAEGLLFPSLYEGFGLPPVEAAVARIPVAASQIPPHQEGLQDLKPGEVCWVQPQDLYGWVGAFHKIYRGEVVPPSEESKLKILRRFSLEKMGQRMDHIYRKTLFSAIMW